MKKYLLPVVMLFAAHHLSAQTKYEKEAYSINHFANAKVTNVLVETTGGNITVVNDNSETRVEVYISPNNSRNKDLSKEEIKQKLEADYDMTISFANNRLTATAKIKKKNNRDWDQVLNVSFKLFVPKDVSTELNTSGGNISLSNLSGKQDFRTSGGNLMIDNLAGMIKGITSGGSIHVQNSKNNIDLSTSGGNITAESNDGTMKLSTSGGNLDLSELKGDIHATTSGGSIHGDHISGDLFAGTSGGSIGLKSISGSLEANTSAGNIDVEITALSKKVTLSNSAGNIYLQLPSNKGVDLRLSANRIKTDALANFKGTKENERIDGTLNGGGVSVRANANGGDIHLSLK